MDACLSVDSIKYPDCTSLVVTLLAALFLPMPAIPAVDAVYHDFAYDAATSTYHVEHEGVGHTIPVDAVKRDLNGALCSICHADEASELKQSVHYRLQGRNDRILFPGGGAHGALDRACGLTGTSALVNYTSDVNLSECGKCHTGRFLPVMEGAFASMFHQLGVHDPAGEAARLVDGGLDCLVCHSDVYSAAPEGARIAGYASIGDPSPVPEGYARVGRDDTDFDGDGIPDLLIDSDGDGVADMPLMMGPGMPWPTIAQDRGPAAVTSVGATNEHNCLRCHEHARTGYKRGTLFAAGYDVHATAETGPFEGAGNRCTVCHTVPDIDGDGDPDHRFVRGHDVGGDLMAADFEPPPPGVAPDPDDPTHLTCVQCHEEVGGANDRLKVHSERHLATIACQTCHIPDSSGITYSINGHGGNLLFGRNAQGRDTLLINADHTTATDPADVAVDFEAYKTSPTYVWFNGGTSFLAQTLSVRGTPNAKIFPFKPMANGMVFDGRFFEGETVTNEAGAPYNAHSMYRFYANTVPGCEGTVCGNAEVFAAMDMLDLTPSETRMITLADFMSPDPDRQAMAMMQIFPNLIQFDKATFGTEHYLVAEGAPGDLDGDGKLDPDAEARFDMFAAANAGIASFRGFNLAMGLPADYDWYPPFNRPAEVVTMKVPDGSLMKMFLGMQAGALPEEQRADYLAAIEHYPAFSNGVTLGGHGVRPKAQALGAGRGGCSDCHSRNGMLANPVPVTRKVATDLGPLGTVDLPMYQWRYYNVPALTRRGVRAPSEAVLYGNWSMEIGDDPYYVRTSDRPMVVNWFAPDIPGGYVPATDRQTLWGVGLHWGLLTFAGGDWMPVLEPIVDYVPNYEVLGYTAEEILDVGQGGGHGGGHGSGGGGWHSR
jgi:hypothetical protein